MVFPVRRKAGVWLAGVLMLAAMGVARPAWAWAHQGHILITRMACLRIINDPAAPQGLRDFLKSNMTATLEQCHSLVTKEDVGPEGEQYLAGFDGACTLPDRIQSTAEGKEILAPYDAPEAKMHFLDMEAFSKEPSYKDDLSHKPKLEDISHDVHDPRWKVGGYVPLRIEECYGKLLTAFGKGASPANPTDALKWAGYLAHYTEDCTQPHHGTMDHKSLSYLVGSVKGVRTETKQTEIGPKVSFFAVRGSGINPHGDVEYRIFEGNTEKAAARRELLWTTYLSQLDEQAKLPSPARDATNQPYTMALLLLSDGYDHLPLIGRAAQAAYATGKFDPDAFFSHKGTVRGQEMTIVQMIAAQNAKATLIVEKLFRQAWADAHK